MNPLAKLTAAAMLCGALPNANATIVSGMVTTGAGSFVELAPGFTESTPNNTVGNNTFQTPNLYAFNEDQNTEVLTTALNVDYLTTAAGTGSLAVGTIVASHYVFYDPQTLTNQEGWVQFDSKIVALITSRNFLNASDYLANTGVTYLNPTQRGLENNDTVLIDPLNPYRILVDWQAANPGDYIRVLTEYSPTAAAPTAPTLALLGMGLLALRRKLSS